MTSWLPWYVLLCCSMVSVCTGASSADSSVCRSPAATHCSDCLRRGPQCAWCFKEDFLNGASLSQRCDLLVNLHRRGCGPEFTEQNDIKVEVNATISGTQVSPGDISVSLRPGMDASFIVAVKQLERYPVDLYYLVDVSASMQENLDHLKTVGVALSLRMREHSSDLWLGFGSFVDKPVSPYINVHPSKINNPCSDYKIHCRPAHGFHHVLSMTGDMSEFTRVIKRQNISGNMDTPEGGLDAMMQAAVCQKAVGWRPEAKRLLLLMTDQPSHLALDSRLAGIVVPHDGLCHLENNVYTGSTRMDHPSVGQLSDKLLENHIYSIFAVEKQQYRWYEKLVHFLPGSYLGKLGLFQAPNLIGLVIDAYKKLLSEVAVSVTLEDKAVSRYWVSVSPLCPDGSTPKGQSCSGVKPNQTVYFNITIGLRSCPVGVESEDITMMVHPVGYNESTVVRVRSECRCRCAPTGRCQDDEESPCRGSPNSTDQKSNYRPMTESKAEPQNQKCRAPGSEVDCSGRGVCDCGRCFCEESRLGAIYGTHCELDDFSCPYEGGILCGSRGVCTSGECVCQDGWTGDSCSCPVSTASCLSPNGLICNGQGKCVCGKCVCDDHRHYGDFCERCPACQSACQSQWKCVDCHITHGLTQNAGGRCNHTCAALVDYTDDTSRTVGGSVGVTSQCVHVRHDSCRYGFQSSSDSGQTRLHISTRPECVSSGRLLGTFLSVCALTVLCGLVVVAVSRLLLQKRGWSLEGAAEEPNYLSPGKDLSYIPTSNEKTVTYRRDHPVEMQIQVPKMPLGDPWQ